MEEPLAGLREGLDVERGDGGDVGDVFVDGEVDGGFWAESFVLRWIFLALGLLPPLKKEDGPVLLGEAGRVESSWRLSLLHVRESSSLSRGTRSRLHVRREHSWSWRLVVHVSLVFVLTCFGFYSVRGTTSGTFASGFLAAVIDAEYPLCYVALVIALRRSALEASLDELRSLCGSFPLVRVVDGVALGLVVTTAVWTGFQKSLWYTNQDVGSAAGGDQFLFYLFAATEVLRLMCACLVALMAGLVVLRFAVEARAFHMQYRGGTAVDDLSRFHLSFLAIHDDVVAAAAAISPLLAALLLVTFGSAVALLVGILLEFVSIEIFWEDASDLFLLLTLSLIVSILCLVADSRLAALPRAIRTANLIRATKRLVPEAAEARPSVDALENEATAFALAAAFSPPPTFHALGIEVRSSTVAKFCWSLTSFAIVVVLKYMDLQTS